MLDVDIKFWLQTLIIVSFSHNDDKYVEKIGCYGNMRKAILDSSVLKNIRK